MSENENDWKCPWIGSFNGEHCDQPSNLEVRDPIFRQTHFVDNCLWNRDIVWYNWYNVCVFNDDVRLSDCIMIASPLNTLQKTCWLFSTYSCWNPKTSGSNYPVGWPNVLWPWSIRRLWHSTLGGGFRNIPHPMV